VVGGGRVALRKVRSLLACGARVTVVSPRVCSGLAQLARQDRVCWQRRAYRSRDASGQRLIIAATDDPRVNAQVRSDARQRAILINVVDDPSHCTVFIPSVIRINPLVVTVATEGRFPGLAKIFRQELTPQLKTYARQIQRLARLRDAVKNSGLPAGKRRQLIQSLLSQRVRRLVASGKIRTAAGLRDVMFPPKGGISC
jgi:precorrin-2 dehydrogenase/sirohydrochlorin ferrochelatase